MRACATGFYSRPARQQALPFDTGWPRPLPKIFRCRSSESLLNCSSSASAIATSDSIAKRDEATSCQRVDRPTAQSSHRWRCCRHRRRGCGARTPKAFSREKPTWRSFRYLLAGRALSLFSPRPKTLIAVKSPMLRLHLPAILAVAARLAQTAPTSTASSSRDGCSA